MPSNTLPLTDNGLQLPDTVRDSDTRFVIRTPRTTIQHDGDNPHDPYYPLITPSDFGELTDIDTPQNPDLAPDTVSIKPRGEPAETYTVDMQPTS